MKTKILSKLMLISITMVMIVGCGKSSKKKNSTPKTDDISSSSNGKGAKSLDPCNFCDETNHYIEIEEAKIMIEEFHRTFINVPANRINNMGGIIDLTRWKLDPSGAPGFRPLKMHFGLDKSRNLILTVEMANTYCYQNYYQGSAGFQSAKLLTTNSHFNPIKRGPINRTDLDNFLDNELTINASFFEIDRKDAEEFNRKFDTEFKSHYECESMYFFPENSIDNINSETGNNNKFAYFFGYDNSDPQAKHKLRVILVGIDDSINKLKLIDAEGSSLMRDYSRPYPFIGPRKK
jgi:hypothetical protein